MSLQAGREPMGRQRPSPGGRHRPAGERPRVGPVAHGRAAFATWLQKRQPLTDTLLLTQRNVYILPTRAGWMFGLTLVVLLLASVNYQLNLGYVLTFLLAGSGMMSMHLTHATLRGLTLHLRPPAAVFAGDAAVLHLVLTSPDKPRFGIGLKLSGAPDATLSWLNVPARGQVQAQVSFVPHRRGGHDAPTLSVETRFPLGLFRSWSVWRPAARLLAYPTPEQPAATLPAARPVAGGALRARQGEAGEMEGVRTYRRGDSLRQIAWKQAAKAMQVGGELVSRDTTAATRQELWLDWQACAGLEPEHRLSRLTAWVVAAHRADAEFGMRLPGHESAPGSGDLQKRRCLEELALWR